VTESGAALAVLLVAALLVAAVSALAGRRAARRAAGQAAAAEAELHRVRRRYRAVVEQSPDAIWLAEAGTLRLANAACVALFGARTAGELVGRPLADFLALEPVDGGQPADEAGARPVLRETTLRRVDGGEREVELWLASVPDHDGPALQGVMRDIGGRRQAEAELRRTQASLAEAQRIARVGYFTYDATSRTWSGSPSLLELLGLPPGTTVPAWDLRLVHPDDRDAVRRHLEEGVFLGRGPFDLEFRILRGAAGEVRWLHALGHGRKDDANHLTHLFGSVQDVTERKLATEALERQREELRRLSASLTEAREQERRHVARELHDELGQRLSALKLDLSTVLRQVGTDAPAVRERLRALLAEVDGAIAATRRIATDLRPAMLDDLGLNAAIDWLAADWTRRAGLKIALDCEPVDDSLTESAATTIYRIVQEGLTNVHRHAHAAEVRIELHRREPDLLLRIFDDGRGLATGGDEPRSASGLTGIRERARLLGGSASLRNRAGRGCVLEVRLPLERIDTRPGALQDTL
jgi:PAS domain S-box-containing protein